MTLKIDYQIYKTSIAPFEEMLHALLESYQPIQTPVRFVFMGPPTDNATYRLQRTAVQREVYRRFGEQAPAISYVAQAPCGTGCVLEVHEVSATAAAVSYKKLNQHTYITVEDAHSKRLFVDGLQGDIDQRFDQQAMAVFAQLEALMQQEQMPLSSIVRQWNYIEHITQFDDSGRQHYQIFNDARSLFYSSAEGSWDKGYPAATGIGTEAGGVLLGLDAVQSRTEDSSIQIHKVDNPLQVAAHSYSQQVLLGCQDTALTQKTTPKFERAKTLTDAQEGMVYISGTAAIRGEHSLEHASVGEQTIMTLENIEYLISAANLCQFQLPARENASLTHLRIYLKNAADQYIVDEIMRDRYPGLPLLYVVADVCRKELLIEMEGAAYFHYR